MLGAFLALAACAVVAVTVVLRLASRDDAIARLVAFLRGWWRPALLTLVLLPVGLLVATVLGCIPPPRIESLWWAILTAPLQASFGIPHAAMAALAIRPNEWTFLLAMVGAMVWCVLAIVFHAFAAAAGC